MEEETAYAEDGYTDTIDGQFEVTMTPTNAPTDAAIDPGSANETVVAIEHDVDGTPAESITSEVDGFGKMFTFDPGIFDEDALEDITEAANDVSLSQDLMAGNGMQDSVDDSAESADEAASNPSASQTDYDEKDAQDTRGVNADEMEDTLSLSDEDESMSLLPTTTDTPTAVKMAGDTSVVPIVLLILGCMACCCTLSLLFVATLCGARLYLKSAMPHKKLKPLKDGMISKEDPTPIFTPRSGNTMYSQKSLGSKKYDGSKRRRSRRRSRKLSARSKTRKKSAAVKSSTSKSPDIRRRESNSSSEWKCKQCKTMNYDLDEICRGCRSSRQSTKNPPAAQDTPTMHPFFLGEGDSVDDAAADGGKCIICLDRKKDTIFRPCNHYESCYTCAKIIRERVDAKCMVCRTPITSIEKVGIGYVADQVATIRGEESTKSTDSDSAPEVRKTYSRVYDI